MPLQATSGAASYDAFGGGVAAVPNYIEECFSCFLYTGNGSTQTITNGIDLSTKGGLVWTKPRTTTTFNDHILVDSARGDFQIQSNTTAANNAIASFNFASTGYTAPSNTRVNASSVTYASWTFRKQPKFFDVVTYTGNGTSQTINHNLGSVPGSIFVKKTSGVDNWGVYHRSIGNTKHLRLNTTDAEVATTLWNNTDPTSTQFSVSGNYTNESGFTYVAYLFAHNAGGFGLTGTDNVISCGSWTGTGSAQDVTLGYEPQFLIIKNATTGATNWVMLDNMRGLPVGTGDAYLKPNLSDAEVATSDFVDPTATGFRTILSSMNTSGNTYIYIAIRRGPMKVPTSGTSVFEPVTSTSANFIKGTLEASDMGWFKDRATVANWFVGDRLRGIMSYYNPTLYTNLTNAEATPTTGDTVTSTSSEGTGNGKIYFGGAGATTDQPLGYSFKRAPSFFDEVCYTGTGSARTVSHNLGVAPELMIVKARVSAGGGNRNWAVYASSLGAGTQAFLSTTDAAFASTTIWGNTSPTASVFSVSTNVNTNYSGVTYVAYLFATCAGVSKVGSYTGTGASGNAVTTGFAPRFLMIKATTTTGGWIVFDSARGIGVGNDPYLYLNSTAAEATGVDWVDVSSSGFSLNTTGNATNGAGETYIYLAIA